MSTNSQDAATNPQINTSPTPEEVNASFNTQLTSADTSATAAILSLSQIHQARLSQLTRTAVALRAKYGPNDPRVQKAAAAVTARAAIVAGINVVQSQTATPDPTVAANGWALHGRVFDPNLKPLTGLTVFLVDDRKAYQTQFGFAYTDATGYFAINFAPPEGTAPAAAGAIFLAIVDTKARPIYLATTAFQPILGAATYQNITLSALDTPLGAPPKEIRKIAFPNAPRNPK